MHKTYKKYFCKKDKIVSDSINKSEIAIDLIFWFNLITSIGSYKNITPIVQHNIYTIYS